MMPILKLFRLILYEAIANCINIALTQKLARELRSHWRHAQNFTYL
ncbi:hypothetical protein [Nostoc sp.]